MRLGCLDSTTYLAERVRQSCLRGSCTLISLHDQRCRGWSVVPSALDKKVLLLRYCGGSGDGRFFPLLLTRPSLLCVFRPFFSLVLSHQLPTLHRPHASFCPNWDKKQGSLVLFGASGFLLFPVLTSLAVNTPGWSRPASQLFSATF